MSFAYACTKHLWHNPAGHPPRYQASTSTPPLPPQGPVRFKTPQQHYSLCSRAHHSTVLMKIKTIPPPTHIQSSKPPALGAHGRASATHHSHCVFFPRARAPDQYPPPAQSPAVPATEQGYMCPSLFMAYPSHKNSSGPKGAPAISKLGG